MGGGSGGDDSGDSSGKMEIPEGMNLVDDAYLEKMMAFEVDCNEGKSNREAAACHHVGEFYSVVKDEHKRSSKIYEKNCLEKGYGASCFNLGKLFLSGKGIEQSDDQAGRYFQMACNNEHLQGCYHQGVLAYLAAAEDQKAKKLGAIKLLDKNCESGDIESCYFAASHYIKKGGNVAEGERNPAKAVTMLEKGCSKNHGPSCFNLAVMFKNGDVGVAASHDKHEKYKARTNELVKQFGGLGGRKTA